MSKAAELADAIVAALNASATSLAFQSKRRAVPFLPTDTELKTLQVAVFSGAKSVAKKDRGHNLRVFKPVVHVIKKLPPGDDATHLTQVNELIDLVEAIETLLDANLVECGFFGFDEEQERDSYNAEALRSHGCFSVAIVLEYRG